MKVLITPAEDPMDCNFYSVHYKGNLNLDKITEKYKALKGWYNVPYFGGNCLRVVYKIRNVDVFEEAENGKPHFLTWQHIIQNSDPERDMVLKALEKVEITKHLSRPMIIEF